MVPRRMKARVSVYRGPGRIGDRKGSNLWVPDCEQGSLSLGSQTELGGGGRPKGPVSWAPDLIVGIGMSWNSDINVGRSTVSWVLVLMKSQRPCLKAGGSVGQCPA